MNVELFNPEQLPLGVTNKIVKDYNAIVSSDSYGLKCDTAYEVLLMPGSEMLEDRLSIQIANNVRATSII